MGSTCHIDYIYNSKQYAAIEDDCKVKLQVRPIVYGVCTSWGFILDEFWSGSVDPV